MSKQDHLIKVGTISGVFGVKGWLKVTSYTEPRANILSYKSWILRKQGGSQIVNVLGGQIQGKNLVAQLADIIDRDQALVLIGSEVYIEYAQLPPAKPGEYYWADLVGLAVENQQGVLLGNVETLFETGANDVIVVTGEKERAIPFIKGQTVKLVDLENGKLVVDWDADF